MKKYKIAISGTGNIFFKHLQSIKSNKNFSICGITDKKRKKKFRKFTFFKNLKDAFKKDRKLDIVNLLTPSGNHFKETIFSLKNRKNVIVEKPLALRLDHVNQILKLEKKFKKKVFVVFQHRLNPAFLELKKCLEKKKLGKIFLVSSKLHWCRNDHYYKGNWRGTWKYDGGVVTNQGIHTIDIINLLFGNFESIFARSNKISKFIETEDVCSVSGRLKKGIICNMEFTTATRPNNLENSITVLGTKGFFKIGGKNFNETTNSFNKGTKKININNLHKKFYKEIYYSLKKNSKNKFSSLSSIKSLETIVGIYQSLKFKKEIKFPIKKNIKIQLGY